MSSQGRTLLSLTDDGAGQIACPRKGLMAIQRCHAWQRETEEEGKACTCPVFLAYGKKEPIGGAEPPELRLCGRVFDAAVATVLSNRIEEDDEEEDDAMATRPRSGANCTKCGKKADEGSHLRGGLCKACRAEVIKGTAERLAKVATRAVARQPAPPATVEQVAQKHSPETKRQMMLPPVAQQELERLGGVIAALEAENAELKRKLDRVSWVADGVRRGYAQLEELVQAAGTRGT